MKLICVCWKTSRNAKASHFGRGVCGADGEGKDAAKEPDTQRYAPCLSEPSYRNAAGVISPGLPSQALTRQLPQSGSPWQRGVVLLRLIEVFWKTSRNAKASPDRRGGIERSEDDGEVSSPQKQIPHTGRLRCGGAGMESENVFKRFCHRRRRCGSCHRRCRCTTPDRGRCAPRPPHRWGRGLQWQKPCSGSRCRPCR